MERTQFERVLRDHKDRIYGHALRCLRDPDDAADVTQEAFLRLWRRGPELDDERLAAWLTRVVHNLCIDRSRRARTVDRYLGRPDPDALGDLAAAGASPDAVGPDHPDLEAAIASLPAPSRSLILLHYWQGLKLKEIAASLGENEGTLKVRLHRARKALRRALDQTTATPLAARQEQSR
jgi:RNA polymerase sigma-70 factor (ECF subfamily)